MWIVFFPYESATASYTTPVRSFLLLRIPSQQGKAFLVVLDDAFNVVMTMCEGKIILIIGNCHIKFCLLHINSFFSNLSIVLYIFDTNCSLFPISSLPCTFTVSPKKLREVSRGCCVAVLFGDVLTSGKSALNSGFNFVRTSAIFCLGSIMALLC